MSNRIDPILRRAARGLPLFLCAAVLSGNGFSQVPGPTAEKGVVAKPLGDIDLASQIGDITGRRLRARLITIAPGGHSAAHSHQGRPTIQSSVRSEILSRLMKILVKRFGAAALTKFSSLGQVWDLNLSLRHSARPRKSDAILTCSERIANIG